MSSVVAAFVTLAALAIAFCTLTRSVVRRGQKPVRTRTSSVNSSGFVPWSNWSYSDGGTYSSHDGSNGGTHCGDGGWSSAATALAVSAAITVEVTAADAADRFNDSLLLPQRCACLTAPRVRHTFAIV